MNCHCHTMMKDDRIEVTFTLLENLSLSGHIQCISAIDIHRIERDGIERLERASRSCQVLSHSLKVILVTPKCPLDLGTTRRSGIISASE